MKLLTFDSQHLDVDWISFNIQGLTDPKTIASNLSKYFTPHVLMFCVIVAISVALNSKHIKHTLIYIFKISKPKD